MKSQDSNNPVQDIKEDTKKFCEFYTSLSNKALNGNDERAKRKDKIDIALKENQMFVVNNKICIVSLLPQHNIKTISSGLFTKGFFSGERTWKYNDATYTQEIKDNTIVTTKINYQDGRHYVGEINKNYEPNGKGMLTAKDETIIHDGAFIDGKIGIKIESIIKYFRESLNKKDKEYFEKIFLKNNITEIIKYDTKLVLDALNLVSKATKQSVKTKLNDVGIELLEDQKLKITYKDYYDVGLYKNATFSGNRIALDNTYTTEIKDDKIIELKTKNDVVHKPDRNKNNELYQRMNVDISDNQNESTTIKFDNKILFTGKITDVILDQNQIKWTATDNSVFTRKFGAEKGWGSLIQIQYPDKSFYDGTININGERKEGSYQYSQNNTKITDRGYFDQNKLKKGTRISEDGAYKYVKTLKQFNTAPEINITWKNEEGGEVNYVGTYFIKEGGDREFSGDGIIKYPDRDYLGEVKDCKPVGNGILKYKNTVVLKAKFKDADFVKEENVEIKINDQTIFVGQISQFETQNDEIKWVHENNRFVYDIKSNKCEIAYKNGDKYKGEINKNALPEGRGEKEYSNDKSGKAKCESDWRDGKPNGNTKIIHTDGVSLEAEFINGKPNVNKNVIIKYNNNIVFEGIISRFNREYNTIKWVKNSDDFTYDGQNEKCEIKYSNGDKYEGKINKNGLPEGFGTKIYDDFITLEAKFINGEPDFSKEVTITIEHQSTNERNVLCEDKIIDRFYVDEQGAYVIQHREPTLDIKNLLSAESLQNQKQGQNLW